MRFRAEISFELIVPDEPTGARADDRKHFPGIFETGRLAAILADLQDRNPDLIADWKLLSKPSRV